MQYDSQVTARLPHLQDDPARQARWAYMTEGITDDYKRVCVEVLLDNEQNVSRSRGGALFEDVVTMTNFPAFTTFAFPLIRRVFPRLIANELVSVQPMNQPTGKVFYFDIEYSAGGSPTAQRVDKLVDFEQNNPNLANLYATAAEAAAVPELDLRISSADVSATTRKLKSKWSLESEQDLSAYFGLNAESELMTAISNEIAREIDRDVIADLYSYANSQGAGNVNWSKTVPNSAPWTSLSPREWYRTLFDALTDANNLIVKQRYRNANWIVVGADVGAIMEKTDEFRLFPVADPVGQIIYGPHLFGSVSGRFTVYKDPWLGALGENPLQILLGYKGQSALDTGYIYAPYVPLLTTPPFTDPNTMTTVRGMMTRYAKKGVIGPTYATVTVS
jgi:hypothetical protein